MMDTKEMLENVFFGEEVKGVMYNAFGYTLKIAGKTITGLTLDEAEAILTIPLPIATVLESKGMYFPFVRFGNREFTRAGFRNWRDCNNAACEIADTILQKEIDKILGV